MYGSQYGDFSKHSNWKVMFGCVTQGKAREFLMYELQQSLEDFVARLISFQMHVTPVFECVIRNRRKQLGSPSLCTSKPSIPLVSGTTKQRHVSLQFSGHCITS